MAERISIELPGFRHTNPIPVASRIGPFLASGSLTGRDPVTGELPPGLDGQCAHVFGHVRALMRAVGGSTDDILKMTFHLAEPGDRAALNREWLALFPDPARRPARQVLAARLGGAALVHCDLLAVLPASPEPPVPEPPHPAD
ncbi:RidA family protein [Streptomyces sp. NPDC050560]|uniref:RidA family protein n=1 Tax=Streptomyces sp. NPDC050560 TaxID=3365630 RepID=UPI0037A663E5